jgi:hypothetical protein
MFKNANQKGFSLLEAIASIFIVVILIAVGTLIYKHDSKDKGSSNNSSATKLTIKRSNPLKQPGVSSFAVNVSGSSAKTILFDIKSLKIVSQAMPSCPLDDGVNYAFTFTDPSLYATASATGCQFVNIGNKPYFTSAKFWKDVANATHRSTDPDTNFQ